MCCVYCWLLSGVSWEEMLIWHQALGYAFLVAIMLHMFLFWVVFSEQGSFPADIFQAPTQFHSDVRLHYFYICCFINYLFI